jgi:dihydroorotate dehydrogenase
VDPYRLVFDRVATRVDAERAHRLGVTALRVGAPALPAPPRDPARLTRALGLDFPNPLGVAAGFDKDAESVRALLRLGFGAVEVGTVTAKPQPGNPRPRLFRLPADRALVNRMGFNNAGADVVATRLSRLRAEEVDPVDGVVGVNIGRSKTATDVVADYAYSARVLGPFADYVVVNVSSPNTPGLRDLQGVDALEPLLTAVRSELSVPLLVKITADLDDPGVDAVADLAGTVGLDGIVATNTTIARDGLRSAPDEVAAAGSGGLSGAPLIGPARAILARLRARVGPETALVSVGGISDGAEARARLDAGATLVQAYTGFVYGGPTWPRRVLADL